MASIPRRAKRVQVTCKKCDISYEKVRHALYGWKGLCRKCCANDPPRKQNYVTIQCKECGTERRLTTTAVALCNGLCKPCNEKRKRETTRVQVTCAGCGRTWKKVRHALYGWSGLCRPCSKQGFQPKKEYVTLPCKQCGTERTIAVNALPKFSGLCEPCYGKIRVPVTCIDCGTQWAMFRVTVNSWSGRCRSCANKAVWLNPEYKERHRELARLQLIAQGGVIPNRVDPPRGAAHWNWKGGITPEHQQIRNSEEHKEWALAVKRRDDFICQDCGRRGGRLHSHHLLDFAEYPEFRFDVDNGVTLCIPCHRKRHAKADQG